MTLPDERYRAVQWAERFLQNIANPKGYPRIPGHVRQEARSILRHYPSTWDLDRASNAAPDVFQPKMEAVTRLFAQYEQSRQTQQDVDEPQVPGE